MNFIEKDLFLGSIQELVKLINMNTLNNSKRCYFAINPDCMLTYWSDDTYKAILNSKNALVYVDGYGVIYAQKLLGLKVASERIATTDLFPELMGYLNEKKSNLRVYLLGGNDDTAARVKERFSLEFPDVKIVGTHHGYFEDGEAIVNEINKLNTDILFVGFGTPLQEKWVKENYIHLQTNTIITCGGLFDYYSGNVKRAPALLRKMGFEWLYRLVQEPRRLYKRYIFGNLKYISKIFKMKMNL
ncbi:WecB/TagA/CpsF family glycosyltransferase [Peribacillus simplex]|uniref:WecB/TagA/CpsF family glycosyltransferase n=1 Tax=Peribacillus simplex TaxID=1478 RepID=UPI0036732E49